jgi:hypothetical protein
MRCARPNGQPDSGTYARRYQGQEHVNEHGHDQDRARQLLGGAVLRE